ncbi:MAG TPA: glycoside hydrolase family 78 protein [Tepidisphaeraceae bacterium]|nr:glycoside hydrolase family 78 protein [Tepidisphaeraceae bacterium]
MQSPGRPANLRCEYVHNPLAIDVAQPRLSWQISDDRRGAVQRAYQVLAATSPDALRSERADLWDTGKVESDQSVHVAYEGSRLVSRQQCFWCVRTWDSAGAPSPWSEVAAWEMGLLQRRDWVGHWIGSSIVGGPYSIPPAPHLRKRFDVSKPIARGRLYVTALGVHEFEINGQRVGQDVFAPGRTEYARRVPYHGHDVTPLLRTGANACGAILGDGWYCGHLHSDPRQTYGDRPRLLAQLVIDFADGSPPQTIATDESWRAGEGPIRSSDMLMGEDYDARLEIPGWSEAGFNDVKWQSVVMFPDPGVELVAHRAPPIRPVRALKPVKPPTVSANKRRHIFDLGQNMVGRVRLRIRNAAPGKTIDLRHVEMLDKDGKPYVLALRTARATDHYTTKGGLEEFFEPRFTFHGFRYVEVRDYPGGDPTVDDITGIVLQSDLDETGEFECSDPLINQLQRNIVWSQRGNFLDIPTDCPQRDERLGWTGDAQVFIRTAAFNMNVANFFAKWLQDMADMQALRGDGRIHSVVPGVTSIHDEGGPAWADAAVICPWTIYLCYGDTRVLAERWGMMSWFMQFLQERCVNHIRADEHWEWKGYGDWLSAGAETPKDLIGTAFYAHCADLMSRIATILEKPQEAAKYRQLFENIRRAWQGKYLTTNGSLVAPTQTAYLLALHFNLLPDELRPRALEALVGDIEQRNMHLSTGFVGTPYLNPVLTAMGRTDIAYALLEQKTFPSWLYPVTLGATTMWERWDGWTPEKGFNDAGMNSYNHYAFGAIGQWLYATVAGIDLDPQRPGYKHILIRPQPGGSLTYARGSLQSMHGRIEIAWRIDGDGFQLDVTIPPNTTATVRVPGERATEDGRPVTDASGIEIGAGRYAFRSVLRKSMRSPH